MRITPTLLLVSDPKKLPEIYHRNADKTGHYITGSFGETESLFNMRSHKTHASFRKHIAGPVCSIRPECHPTTLTPSSTAFRTCARWSR